MKEILKKEYCEYFGVDSLSIKNITDIEFGNIVEKTEITHSCFGLIEHKQTVKFYDYEVIWKMGNRTFKTNFSPIIKKFKIERDTRYSLDEKQMKEQVLKAIRIKYEKKDSNW